MATEDNSIPSKDEIPARAQSGPSTGSAGGVFMAIGSIVGAILGGFLGQPSVGFLAGLTLGGLIAIGIWLLSR